MKPILLLTLGLLACLLPVPRAEAVPGNLDPLNANIDGYWVKATAVQPDGKIIIAGFFTSVLGAPRSVIARLNADGTLDMGFNPDINGGIDSVAVQADGGILLGGTFTSVNGTARNRIARLNGDGTLDAVFNPDANGQVYCVAVQADGGILLGGAFTSVGGTARNYIARVSAAGTLEPGFNPNADYFVHSVAVEADGSILLGGWFSNMGGTGRISIARVSADGALDTGFNPNLAASGSHPTVGNVTVQADGRILILGTWDTVGGTGRDSIARLNANGTLDAAFNPGYGVGGPVNSVAVQTDGGILLGGQYYTIGGAARHSIARVDAAGTIDAGFNPDVSAGYPVHSVAVQADGRILLGGSFPGVGGTVRNLFARLLNDPATQTLSAPNATTVTWNRSGSSPEVSQVTFERSTTGGTTWTPLGNGTRIGTTSNWQLTGLSLPASGHLRARGRTSGGGGSSGLIEHAANFSGVPLPTLTDVKPTNGPTAGGITITLTGTGFTGADVVTFGGTAAANVMVVNPTTITATTPAHAAGATSVFVITPGGTNAANTLYTYVAPPTVTSISPSSGTTLGGTSVTITGTGFTSNPAVSIGGTAATGITFVNATTITATTPAGAAGAANVLVTTPYGTNAANTLYTYVAPPTVTSISPSSGTTLGGTSVTITGTGFTSNPAVGIGGTAATGITFVNATTITAVTPAGIAGTASVLVTTPGGTNAANTLFTFDATPPVATITSPTAATTFLTAASTTALGGTASDNVGVASVTWANAANSTSGTATGTTSWSVASVALVAGANAITVTATDTAGNTATDVITITRDNTAPVATITSPTNATTFVTPTSTTALSGTASDNVGVALVTWANAANSTSGTATGTTSWTVASVALVAGANVITVTATDTTGNTATDVITITRDNTAPVATITSPTAATTFVTAASSTALGGTASDNVGVASVTWANAANSTSGTATGTTSWSVASVALVAGANAITVTATDTAGNMATDVITITRDITADYTVTTTGGAIVVTDVSGNGDTLSVSEPTPGTIRFTAAGRYFSVDGGAVIAGNSGNLSLSGITSVTVNADAGTDTINVGPFTTAGGFPGLTLNGGTGNDTVNLNGNLTFAANASLDVDLQNDAATPGTDSVTVANNANILTSGTGSIAVKVSRNLLVNSGGRLATVNGGITIEANLQVPTTALNFDAVDVAGGTIQSTGSGNVTISGKGGNGANPSGVVVRDGGVISGGTSGIVSVTGTGGNGAGDGGGTNNLVGILVTGATSSITSGGANVQVTGTGGTSTGPSSIGVLVLFGGTITAGGTGSVMVTGTGGSGTEFNFGVDVVTAGSKIASTNGPLTVIGTGGNGGSSNFGVLAQIEGVIAGGGAHSVTVTGTGGGGSGGLHHGAVVQGTGAQKITSGGGDIIVTGTAGTGGTSSLGVNLTSGSITTVASGRNVTLVADKMNLQAAVSAGSTGTVTLRQKTNAVAINLGSAVDTTAGTLELSTAELNNVTCSTLNIGDGSSGTINVTAVIAPGSYTTLALAGNTLFSAAGGFSAQVGPTAAVYEKMTVTGTAGITAGATFAVASTGGYVWNGTDTFTFLANDGSDAITGTFTGPTLTSFLGSSLTAAKSHAGGTGNDFVIGPPTAAPDIAVAQAGLVGDGGSVAFGSVSAGGSGTPLTFTITNPGTAALTGLAVTKDGAGSGDYSVDALSATSIPVGAGTATFRVTFSPTSVGVKTAALHIASNVTGTKNPYDIILSGTGVDTVAPDTTITSTNPTPTNSTGRTITFSGTDNVAVTGFEGRLDGAAFTTVSSPVTLSGLGNGTHTYEVRAKDAVGNVDATPASMTWVVDTVAPTLSLPANMTVEATGATGAVVTYTGSASDAGGSGVATSSFTPASGSTFPLGTTTVNASATDHAGNTASRSFTVTVQDTTPPVIANLPENLSVPATSASGAVVTFTNPMAQDAVDGAVTVTCVPPSGSTFPLGETTVNATATDSRSNSSSANFTVTVTAVTAPLLAAPTSRTITDTTATLGATVNSDGGEAITVRGVVYAKTSENADPQIGGTGVVNRTVAGTTGTFQTVVSGLAPGTAYSFAAYATNASGTAYTSVAGFTTSAPTAALYATGQNYYGQLGDGTTTDRWTFTAVMTSGALAGKTGAAFAGSYHSVALDSDGRVYTWGSNSYGQLGDGTTTNRTTPEVVDMSGALAGKTLMAVASGEVHNVALDSDGRMYAWGHNGFGQLGDGTTTDRTTPVAVDMSGALAGKTLVAVAAGSYHSMALDSDGRVYTWGSNSYGQLGDGTTTQRTTPVAVSVSGALAGKNLVAVAAGGSHSVALDSDGHAYAWGSNYVGQLGDGTTGLRTTPVAVSVSGALVGKTLVAVAAGWSHSVALGSDGRVYAWGDNNQGQLGDGTWTDRHTPVAATDFGTVSAVTAGGSSSRALVVNLLAVTAPAFTNVTATSANLGGTVTGDGGSAITERGVVYAASATNPDPAIGGAGVTKVTASGALGLFTTEVSGLVANTGYSFKAYSTNSEGIRYSGAATFTTLNTPPSAPDGTATGTTGDEKTLAISFPANDADGDAVAITGAASGTGVTVNSFTATTVTFTPGLSFMGSGGFTYTVSDGMDTATGSIAVTVTDNKAPLVAAHDNVIAEATSAAGAVVTYAPGSASDNITASPSISYSQNSGTTFPMGTTTVTISAQDEVGNVGTGTFTVTVQDTTPPEIEFTDIVVAATSTSGAAVSFSLSAMDLVDGAVTPTSTPASGSIFPIGETTVQVMAMDNRGNESSESFTVTVTGAPEIVVEQPVGTAIQAGSTSVVAWGNNDYGQTTVPAGVQSGATAIAAGGGHTVALKSNGSVVAWGHNNLGQTTVPLEAQSGVTAIAAGAQHTVALKGDGSVVAWGRYDYGQTTLPPGAQSGVSAIAAGSLHTVALKSDGSVLAWGSYVHGQTTVPEEAQSGVTAIAAGHDHTVALKSDGSVVAWGRNDSGQTTVPPEAQSGVAAIAAGLAHTVALKSDGSVVAWGNSNHSQTTVPPGAQSGVTAIDGGGYHTVALKSDSSVVAWGNSDYSQTTVPAGAQSGVTAIAAGGFHTVAIVTSTSTVSFAIQPTGTPSTAKSFVVKNTGTGALALTGVSVTGGNAGDFTVDTTGMLTSVPAGGQTSFSVTFTPGAPGARATTLRILNNDADENPFNFSLQGTGFGSMTEAEAASWAAS